MAEGPQDVTALLQQQLLRLIISEKHLGLSALQRYGWTYLILWRCALPALWAAMLVFLRSSFVLAQTVAARQGTPASRYGIIWTTTA